jgi:cyclin-dependent kinase 2
MASYVFTTKANNLPSSTDGPTYAQQKDYKLTKLLGAGAFGQVWKATDPNQLDVAIKYIMAEYDDEGYPKDTLTEIAIPLSLNHPNIVKYSVIIDPFVLPGYDKDAIGSELLKSKLNPKGMRPGISVLGLVMPPADGDISALTQTKMPGIQMNYDKLAYQMIDAVAYLTSHNIIHRDIKPQNILYSECSSDVDYMLYLTDFGIAMEGACYGWNKVSMAYTVWYRPPELFLGDDKMMYDAKTDVWALGATLYEMYTGTPLFYSPIHQTPLAMLLVIFGILGEPKEDSPLYKQWKLKFIGVNVKNLPNPLLKIKTSNSGLYDLLNGMLKVDPAERMTIFEARSDPVFDDMPISRGACYTIVKSEEIECVLRDKIFDRDLDFLILTDTNKTSRDPVNIHITQNWMLKILRIFRITERSVYFTAIQLLFRYLMVQKVELRDLQLVATASLAIANTYFSEPSYRVTDYAYESKGSVTAINNMKQSIMKTLDFDLVANTPFDVIQGYNHRYHDSILKLAGDILAQISLTDYYFEKINGRFVYRKSLPETCLALAIFSVTSKITRQGIIATSPVLFNSININNINHIIELVNSTIEIPTRPMFKLRILLGVGISFGSWETLIDRYRRFIETHPDLQSGLILAYDVESGGSLVSELPTMKWFYQKVPSNTALRNSADIEDSIDLGDTLYNIVIVGKCGDECLGMTKLGMSALKSGGLLYSESLVRFILRNHVIATLKTKEYLTTLNLIEQYQNDLAVLRSNMLELSIRKRTVDISIPESIKLEHEYNTTSTILNENLDETLEFRDNLLNREIDNLINLYIEKDKEVFKLIAKFLSSYKESFGFDRQYEGSGRYLILTKV